MDGSVLVGRRDVCRRRLAACGHRRRLSFGDDHRHAHRCQDCCWQARARLSLDRRCGGGGRRSRAIRRERRRCAMTGGRPSEGNACLHVGGSACTSQWRRPFHGTCACDCCERRTRCDRRLDRLRPHSLHRALRAQRSQAHWRRASGKKNDGEGMGTRGTGPCASPRHMAKRICVSFTQAGLSALVTAAQRAP